MINVLVLGVGGNVSQGIIKALKKSRMELCIIGACISPFSAGLYMCDEACLSPYAADDDFMAWLIDLCNKRKVDIILTGVEEIIKKIAEHIHELCCQTHSVFVSSSYEQLLIGQDKYLTAQWLKENKCNYPQYCILEDKAAVKEFIEKVEFPFIAKPRCGKSSKGIHMVYNDIQLKQIEHLQNYVLEEYIGCNNSEYTVGCYCDRNGILVDMIIMHRMLNKGTTIWAEIVDNEKIRREAEKICMAFNPRGPLNIQMRLDATGNPVCFELNVRFSGTTAIRANFGFCDVEAMIREYVFEESIEPCFHIISGEVYRYDEEMYLLGNAAKDMQHKNKIVNMNKFQVSYGSLDCT